jgi:hypothetical protein
MKLTPEIRSRLAHHARMFTLAVFGAFAVYMTLMVVFYALLALGVIHGEFR